MLKNYSSITEFYLLGFPGSKELHNILFATFFFFGFGSTHWQALKIGICLQIVVTHLHVKEPEAQDELTCLWQRLFTNNPFIHFR